MAEKTQGKKRPLSTPIRVIGQWLDSDFRREDAPNTESLPDKINWERTLPFIFLHLGCLAVFLVGFSWVSAGAAIFLYLLRFWLGFHGSRPAPQFFSIFCGCSRSQDFTIATFLIVVSKRHESFSSFSHF